MACQILYDTFYGSTREYAEVLGERLGVAPVGFGGEPVDVPAAPGEPLVIFSPVHGPNHPGAKFVKSLDSSVVESRPIALVTVGMTLIDDAITQDSTAKLLGRDLAERVTRFYLPGRLNYSQLSPKHAGVMRSIVGALRLKPGKTANERNMIDMYGRDTDNMDLARLGALAEWVEDRQDPAT